MPRLPLILLSVALSLVSLTSCLGTKAAPQTAGDSDTSDAIPAEFVIRSEHLLRERFGGEMRRLLLAGQYDSLDHIARDLRQRRTKWGNGLWKLRSFYLGLDEPTDEVSETEWETLLGHLREWTQTRPTSVTARVALAQALVGYAWHARGEKYARDVSKNAMRLFQSRLREAVVALEPAWQLAEFCPGVSGVALQLARGLGADPVRHEAIYDAAIAREPSYEKFYEERAMYLLPRWHGQPGDWERYAEAAADGIGGREGDAMYARIVWSLADYHWYVLFKETSASWERVVRGYQHLLHIYPNSLEVQSQFARLAIEVPDQAQAGAMFARIGSRIDPSVWSEREYFVAIRAWALQ